MKAYIVRQHGDLSALQYETLADPQPGPGEVLVRVVACGLNHLDLWVRRGVPGHRFPLPLILGSDVAGVVASVGLGVVGLAPGDEVVVAPGVSCGACKMCLLGRDHHCSKYSILGEHRDGGYADYVCVPRVNILPKPANLSFDQAAATGVAFLTAWHMLNGRAELKPGETVLIQGATGGVGSSAVQIAKMLGAKVIAVTGQAEKVDRLYALGADHVLNSTDGEVFRDCRKLTDGRGVDVVFEHVGAATWQTSMRCLAWQGRLVTCGATTGNDVSINLNHVFFKSISILGSTMGSKGELIEVLEHVAAGRLRPVVDQVLPLIEAPKAHELIENRHVFGKVILRP